MELLGKEPGADPENPAGREKTLLVKQTSERLGVTAGSLLGVVGIARSTYRYQIKAMDRPNKDAWLLPLVEDVLLQFFLSNFCTIFPQYGLPVSSRNCTI